MLIGGLDNRNVTLGACLSAYVTGTATRKEDGSLLTFESVGIRLSDRFEFRHSQGLGVWRVGEGLNTRLTNL